MWQHALNTLESDLELIHDCDFPECLGTAFPDGEAFTMGGPPGDSIVMRKWRCDEGHIYQMEEE
jgi:hypothetical protein